MVGLFKASLESYIPLIMYGQNNYRAQFAYLNYIYSD